MGLCLSHFLKYNNWGLERVKAGNVSPDEYFSSINLVRDSHCQKEKGQLLILLHSFFAQFDWMEQLSQLKQIGAVAVAYIEGQNPSELISQAIEFCRHLELPLLELPEHILIDDLLLQSEQLFYIDESQAITTDQMLGILRQAINKNKLNGLLRALHTWLRCQAIISIKHDIYAYPPISNFDETNTSPLHWRRLPDSSLFPWVENYYIPKHCSYCIRCQIMHDGNPLGVLILNHRKQPFDKKDLKIADYAALLCSGLAHSFAKSTRVYRLLANAYEGVLADDRDLELFAEDGYALVLREKEKPLLRDSARLEENDFLGYLIHTTFGDSTYYAFLDNDALVIFCSTQDVHTYTKELIALLQKNNRFFQAGVSACYPKEKIITAFAEAKHASNIGKYLDMDKEIFFFHDMGIYRLFNYPDYGWTINQILDDMTEKLDTMDLEKKRLLTTTLTCLVRNNFNYSKTSEELFAHPNTIRYRIGLLEELWGVELSKDENRLFFSVVGKLLPLWQHYTGRL